MSSLMPLDPVPLREFREAPALDDRAQPRSQLKVLGFTALVLVAVIAAFVLYHRYDKASSAARMAFHPPPTPITAVAAEIRPVSKYLSAIGTLVAVRQVTVAPEVGGMVTQIMFTPGAEVNAGDPLVQLNDAPERGDLASFQALARVASANLDRDKQLSAREFQSRQVVDQQQSLRDQAEAGIAKAQAQIAQKLIRAPFAGQLGVRQVNLGGYLNPGGAIVTLTDLSSLWANFTVPEQASSQIKVGQAVNLKADAYPGRAFKATITAIEPQISQQTRTILIQATLDNADHALFPGMFVDVSVVLPEAPATVVVPETAVDFSLYGDSVFVVSDNGKDEKGQPALKVKRVYVKTGERFDGKVEILSGLKGDERVAGSGQLRLSNDAPIMILPGNVLDTKPSITRY
jgi:multidrug efflux system membrane fusion protein